MDWCEAANFFPDKSHSSGHSCSVHAQTSLRGELNLVRLAFLFLHVSVAKDHDYEGDCKSNSSYHRYMTEYDAETRDAYDEHYPRYG